MLHLPAHGLGEALIRFFVINLATLAGLPLSSAGATYPLVINLLWLINLKVYCKTPQNAAGSQRFKSTFR